MLYSESWNIVLNSNPIAAFPTMSRAVREAKFIMSSVTSLDPEPLTSALIFAQSLKGGSGYQDSDRRLWKAYMFCNVIEGGQEASNLGSTEYRVQKLALSLMVIPCVMAQN
jgi:hypothetical protein